MSISTRIDGSNLAQHASKARHQAPGAYLAMYSSYLGGITTDPACMLVPVDDHLVHRGDGVFETLKAEKGAIYNMHAHLARLERSAAAIHLALPFPLARIADLLVETVLAGGTSEALIRLLISRGPGSLGVNPLDCPQSHLYIIAAALPPPFMTRCPQGAHIGFSSIPPKPSPFAEMKSCNYLPNALMAREGRERGLDFVIGVSPDNNLLEGPTENMAIITQDQRLQTPAPPGLLAGTTLERALALATPLLQQKQMSDIQYTPISASDATNAQEILIFGTTSDVTAVTRLEGKPVGTGQPGPIFAALHHALRRDIESNPDLRTALTS